MQGISCADSAGLALHGVLCWNRICGEWISWLGGQTVTPKFYLNLGFP